MPSNITLPDLTPAQLNDFVLVMERNRTNGYSDIVNTDKPAHMALMRKGSIKNEPPGIGPNRNVKFTQSRRARYLSPTQRTAAREFAVNEFLTQAQFRYIAMKVTMTLDEYTEDMTQGSLARYNYIKTQMDEKDMDLELTYNDILWNGITIGSTPCWGINDIVQFVPTADPARGAVGGLSVTQFSQWANQTANFNGPYVGLAAGGRLTSMLDTGTNSLSSVFRRASNNKENGTSGKPDVMLVNEPYMLACEGLARDGLLSHASSSQNQLGVDSFMYKGMDIVWDENVPDDPNDSSYGVGIGLNCEKGFQVIYPEGFRRKVGDRYQHPTHDGACWDTKVYLSTATGHRGLNFVHYGIKGAEDLAA